MIKVMTYNIRHGLGVDDQIDLERISEVIKNADAHIVGLQEVDKNFGDRSNFQDQAKELAKLLDYHYCFGGNLIIEDGEYGNAVLSKFPLMTYQNTLLFSGGEERRGLLHVTIDVNGSELHLFNTHLALNLATRMTEVKEITEVMAQYSGEKVLLGDFNTTPDQADYQFLIEEGKMKDVLTTNENTFPSTEPKRRIDYILVSEGLHFANAQVIASLASDHLPICVEIELP